MKNLSKLLLLLLVIAVVLATAVACKQPEQSLSVKEDAMPQLTHVQGEELDLSKGVLILKTGDDTEEIAMNAEGVSISGYDSTKLGEQTVTITYGDVSTTLTVTVVERMQVVDYTADYLVDDEFDKSAGRLRITKNDGTTFTVILNNQNVEIVGFDSSGAGTGLSVTAKYTSGDDVYEASFKVNVYDVESVKLHAPNKKAYNSHEESIVLDGGYLTLTGNGGALKKDIKLTDENVVITEFDLGAVNALNSPFTQRVYVTYKEHTAEYYDIKITYTSVSNFNDNASRFDSLDWTADTLPTISDELGELALELMDLYIDLSPSEALLIDEAELLNVARTAVSYGYNLWLADLQEFDGAFSYEYDTYSSSYGLFMDCESYEAVESALEKLKVSDRPIYRVYDLLVKILEVEALTDEVSIYVLTPIAGGSMFEAMIPLFETMLEFYDDYLPLIPADWQTAGTGAYSDEIEQVFTYMANGYVGTDNSWVYEQAAAWRADNDSIKTFDALYTYYYEQLNGEAIAMLAATVLPSDFVELVDFIDVMIAQLEYIEYGYMYDTTDFIYNYYNLIELANAYAYHSDEMVRFFYLYLPVNTIFGYDSESTLTFQSIIEYIYLDGFVPLTASFMEIETYEALMEKYVQVYGMVLENENYLTSEEYGIAVEEMFALYLELSASEQNLFLATLMPYYSYGYYYAFSDSEEMADYVAAFSILVNEYYMNKFTTDAAKEAYLNLMVAYETYSMRFFIESWHDKFVDKMLTYELSLELANADEQALFNAYFSSVISSCNRLADKYADGEPKTELGEWEAVFDELYDAIGAMMDAASLIDGGELDESGYYFYNVFFCAYERAMGIVDRILTEAPDDIVEAYYSELLYVIEYTTEDGSGVESYKYTYDFMLSVYRSSYMLYVVNVVGSLDYYKELGYVEFFDQAYDLVIPYFNSILYGMEELFVVDKDIAIAIIYAYSQLSDEAKITHLLMEGGIYSTYYNAVDMFVTENYGEAATTAIFKIIDLEYALTIHFYFLDEESINDVKNVLVDLVALYEGLEGDDKAEFADYEALYTYYVELAEAAIEEVEASN